MASLAPASMRKAVLPELGDLHGRKRGDREGAEHLLGAHFHAAAQEIAAEAPGRGLGRADADDAARGVVAVGAEAQRPGRIERAPRLDRIAAEMRALEMAAGDAVADREVRAAAADGEAGQEIGCELIIEPARQTPGIVGEVGAADARLPTELRAAVETGEPRAPARLIDRRLLGDRLEGRCSALDLFAGAYDNGSPPRVTPLTSTVSRLRQNAP